MTTNTNPFESIGDALIAAITALGGSKVVGQMLKPVKLPDEAGRWLRDCLNADRREKLEIEEILLILREAKKVGCHVATNFICNDAGYANPQPIEPEDEKVRVQREFIEAIKQQTRNIERLEQLSGGGK